MKKIKFTPEARESYKKIIQYTQDQWGNTQTQKYSRKIATRIQSLSHFPQLSSATHLEGTDLKKLKAEQHYIMYSEKGSEIKIWDIVSLVQDSVVMELQNKHEKNISTPKNNRERRKALEKDRKGRFKTMSEEAKVHGQDKFRDIDDGIDF